ncbi:chromate transporter [Clostridium sp.]|uniref:chromate transporter n=1 Tax=Clostridium sp. TaxID=1506 RepID=UPI002FCA6E03
MKRLLMMFLTFFKIGSFTFGGGYAMIPLIEAEVVSKNKWLTKDEFIDVIVVSQTFPGALAVNSCTFIGYKLGGPLGATLGLLGVVLPSFLIILLIAIFFDKFRSLYIVELIFKGINAAVPLLILVGVNSISKVVSKTTKNILIIVATISVILIFDVNPVYIILVSGIYGIMSNRRKVE